MTRTVVIGAVALGVSVAAAATDLPPLPSTVHPRAAAANPQLARQIETAVRARQLLLADADAFDDKCARVKAGSGLDSWCRETLPALHRRVTAHCADTMTVLLAYFMAVEAALDQTSATQRRTMAELQTLQTQFRTQVTGFESWQRDAESGLHSTREQIRQAFPGGAAAAIIDGTEARLISRLDLVLQRVKASRSVRHVRLEEVREYVLRLRRALEGKTKAQARSIVLDAIDAERLAIRDAAAVTNFGVDVALRAPPVVGARTADADLHDAYAAMVTVLKIRANHAVKIAQRFANVLGFVALVPSMMDAAFLMWETHIDKINIDALQQLNDLARQRQADASAAMTQTVRDRTELERIRTELKQSTQMGCR